MIFVKAPSLRLVKVVPIFATSSIVAFILCAPTTQLTPGVQTIPMFQIHMHFLSVDCAQTTDSFRYGRAIALEN